MLQGKPAKKYSQAGRLHGIIRLLEARRGMTLGELAVECGVGRRTIRCDLNAVEEARPSVFDTAGMVSGGTMYSAPEV